MGEPRLMLAMLGGAAIVVGAIGVLALGTWWVLIVAVAALAIVSVIVLGYVGRTINENTDKPDPVTEARLEEEGQR